MMKYQGEVRITFEAMNHLLTEMHPPGITGKEAMHTFATSSPGILVGYQQDLFTHVSYPVFAIVDHINEYYFRFPMEVKESLGIKHCWVDPQTDTVHIILYSVDGDEQFPTKTVDEGQAPRLIATITTADTNQRQ